MYYFYVLKTCEVLYVLWFGFILFFQNSGISTGVLISNYPGQEENKLMFAVWMAWISFGTLPYRKKKTWWQLVSWCWNRMCPWHASEPISFLVGLRTYRNPGTSGRSVVLATFPVWQHIFAQLAKWSRPTTFTLATSVTPCMLGLPRKFCKTSCAVNRKCVCDFSRG